jgi:RimJ/RimL family protein N-acetyltransferase
LPFSGSRSTTCSSPAARSRLIFTEHQRVADWCEARIEHFSGWGSDPKAIGYEVEGVIKGGVVYTNYTPANVFASIALDAPINRRFLYAIFYNPFVVWNVRHLSCAIEESNAKSIKLCSNMGFIQEGRLRESAINGEDVILMGMLKSECRFL